MHAFSVVGSDPGRLRQPGGAAHDGARFGQWVILGISVVNLLFTVGFVLWAMPLSVLHPIALIFRIVLGLGVLSAVMTVGALGYAVLAWKNTYWGVAFRVHYTLATLAAVAFVWFLNYWNLLGWRY